MKLRDNAREYTGKIELPGLGSPSVTVYEMAQFLADSLDYEEGLDFVVCFDKVNEDWGFTDEIGRYAVGEVVDLLASDFGDKDSEWKQEIINTLEGWLKRLKA